MGLTKHRAHIGEQFELVIRRVVLSGIGVTRHRRSRMRLVRRSAAARGASTLGHERSFRVKAAAPRSVATSMADVFAAFRE